MYTHTHTPISSHVKDGKQVASMLAQATHTKRQKNKHKDPEIKQNKTHLVPELFSNAERISPLLKKNQDKLANG